VWLPTECGGRAPRITKACFRPESLGSGGTVNYNECGIGNATIGLIVRRSPSVSSFAVAQEKCRGPIDKGEFPANTIAATVKPP